MSRTPMARFSKSTKTAISGSSAIGSSGARGAVGARARRMVAEASLGSAPDAPGRATADLGGGSALRGLPPAALLLLLVPARQRATTRRPSFCVRSPGRVDPVSAARPSMAGRPGVELSTLASHPASSRSPPRTHARAAARATAAARHALDQRQDGPGRRLGAGRTGRTLERGARGGGGAALEERGPQPDRGSRSTPRTSGPPALWLVLELRRYPASRAMRAGPRPLMGAEDAPARLATEPIEPLVAYGGRCHRAPGSARTRGRSTHFARAPEIAGVFLLGVRSPSPWRGSCAARPGSRSGGPRRSPPGFVVGLRAGLALFLHNRELNYTVGLRPGGPLRVTSRFSWRKGSVPLADDGWQMYQPPLYYGLAAGLTEARGPHDHRSTRGRTDSLARLLRGGHAGAVPVARPA